MKTSWIYVAAGAFLVFIFVYTFSNSEDNYKDKIRSQREEYEYGLRHAKNSPLENKAAFTGLTFFEPSLDAIIEAKLVPYEEYKTIELMTNAQNTRVYRYYANLNFSIGDSAQSLTLLQNIEDETDLFLPFYDASNGKETYAGGRYLPVELSVGKKIILDFNLAFNPYCTYNKEYICPFPPKENRITVAIEAGEKYKSDYYHD